MLISIVHLFCHLNDTVGKVESKKTWGQKVDTYQSQLFYENVIQNLS